MERVGQLVERLRDVGAPAKLDAIERRQQRPQVSGPRADGNACGDLVVEGHQANRVALSAHQIGQGGGEIGGVLQLRHLCGRVAHRGADIEQEMALQVRLFFELLDVVSIAAREDLPIDGREIVARQVLPIFRELDAEPFVGTPMQPDEEALDNRPGAQFHRADSGDDGGIEKAELVAARRRGHLRRSA